MFLKVLAGTVLAGAFRVTALNMDVYKFTGGIAYKYKCDHPEQDNAFRQMRQARDAFCKRLASVRGISCLLFPKHVEEAIQWTLENFTVHQLELALSDYVFICIHCLT